MLEVYKGREASKQYENSFFRELANNLVAVFEKKNMDGVLIGHSRTDKNDYLKPDCLLITENRILIIELKKRDKQEIFLPNESNFSSDKWKTSVGVPVEGGKSINPFEQVRRQSKWLANIATSSDNTGGIATLVLFSGDVTIQGSIPGKYEGWFDIANGHNYLNKIEDIINVNAKQKIDPSLYVKYFKAEPFEDLVPIKLGDYEEFAKAGEERDRALDALQEAKARAEKAEKILDASEQDRASTAKLKQDLEHAQQEVEQKRQKLEKAQEVFDDKKHASEKAWAEALKAEEYRKKAEAEVETEKERTKQTKIEARQRKADRTIAIQKEKSENKWRVIKTGIIIAILLTVAALTVGLIIEDNTNKRRVEEQEKQERRDAIIDGRICMNISEVKDYIGMDGVCVEYVPTYISHTDGGYKYLQMWDKKDGDFMIYISNSKYNTLKREDAQKYRNKTIEVRGKIVNYSDKKTGRDIPEIEVFSQSAITIKDGS